MGTKELPKSFYFLLKYRIHISIFSISIIISFYSAFLHIPPDWVVTSAFFIWNFALYLFDRAYDGPKDMLTQPMEAITPVERKPLIILSVALSLLPILLLYGFNKPVLPYLVFVPLTFIYTFPLFNEKRVKNFLFIKNLYSAVVIWSLPVLFIAYYYVPNVPIDYYSLIRFQLFPLFLYVLIGEAVWDIRDVDGDKINKVKTIPVVFGIQATKVYLYSLLVIDLLTTHFHISLPLVIYCLLIYFVTPKSPRWWFHLPPLITLLQWILSLTLH